MGTISETSYKHAIGDFRRHRIWPRRFDKSPFLYSERMLYKAGVVTSLSKLDDLKAQKTKLSHRHLIIGGRAGRPREYFFRQSAKRISCGGVAQQLWQIENALVSNYNEKN